VIIKRITWRLTILAAVLVVLIILPNFFRQNLKGILLAPLKYPLILSNASSENAIDFFRIANILEENRYLRKEVDELKKEVVNLREAKLENERLRELLNIRKELPYKTEVARVIGKDSSNWHQAIIIDKGGNRLIEVGSPVTTYSGLVGRVIERYKNSSRVLLITDPSLQVAARVQRTRDEGLVEGMHKGLCRMKYLTLESEIMEGDRVITSGLSSFFPEGLLIGKIISVETDPSNLYQIAVIKPEVDFRKLEEVICLEKRKSF
jgi:rod shape-determining protein MreC